MCTPIIQKSLIIIACLSLFFVSGCISVSPTQPNLPHTNYHGYNTFEKTYSLIADEIGKLPEIQDGISVDEKKSIDFLIKIFSTNPKKFQKVFLEMYNTGYPEVRKYCTPLQAAFWLIEDGKTHSFVNFMNNYDLKSLLELSWRLEYLILTESDVKLIVNEFPKKLKSIYQRFDYSKKLYLTNKLILHHYENNKNDIPIHSRSLIEKAIALNKTKKRWGNMQTVMERLNSPYLVNWYEQKEFAYKSSAPIHCNGNNRQLFRTKAGCCGCYTKFSIDCLKMAGYDAKPIQVKSPSGKSYHLVCEFIDKDFKLYIIDNSWRNKGIVKREVYVGWLPQLRVGWHY